MVTLTVGARHGRVVAMRHRHAILAALALSAVLALMFAGRVHGADPSRWTPQPGDTWQYQLSGAIDVGVVAEVFDVDAFTTRRATVTRLHRLGRHAVCYIDAGSWEPYRPDAGQFPASMLGRRVAGWPDERWLDIRRLDVLKPIMRGRLDRCVAKGFDGVEFDWIDSYQFDTGFRLTRADQLQYDRWLARAAHDRGLAVGLKNGLELVRALVGVYDFAVNEQCFQYRECGRYRPFLDAGKAVLNVEYELARSQFCPRARSLGISAIRKRIDLRAWRRPC
jgi:hypothetical protein